MAKRINQLPAAGRLTGEELYVAWQDGQTVYVPGSDILSSTGISTPKDPAYGAKGDGVTDDTVAFQAWLTALASTGGSGRIPAGTYVLSAAIEANVTASCAAYGDGAANTILLFTANVDGLTFSMKYANGVWGGLVLSNLSIWRAATSPAQSNIGVSFVADPTVGSIYMGESGLTNVNISGQNRSSTSWQTGVFLSSMTNFNLSNCFIQGPAPTSGGTDAAVSVVGANKLMFSTGVALTNGTVLEGFSTGLAITGYMQGMMVAPTCSIVGAWWGLNWTGVSGPTNYAAASTVTSGSVIYVSTAAAAALIAGGFTQVSGTGITPDTSISSVNAGTGAITLGAPLVGTVTSGETLSFAVYYYAEVLDATSVAFNSVYRDVYLLSVDSASIIGCNFLKISNAASDWAAIECAECAFTSIVGNFVEGLFHGDENGILYTASSGVGAAPVAMTGNAFTSIAGVGVALNGSGFAGTGATVAAAVVTGNSFFACAATVTAETQGSNIILNNVLSGSPPDISVNVATGHLIITNPAVDMTAGLLYVGSNTASVAGLTLNVESGAPAAFSIANVGELAWQIGVLSGEDFSLARHDPTTGDYEDTPFSISSSTGVITMGGTVDVGTLNVATLNVTTALNVPEGVIEVGSNTAAVAGIEMNVAANNPQAFSLKNDNLLVWQIGILSGVNFSVARYNPSTGAYVDTPIGVSSANGGVTMSQGLGIFGATPPTSRPSITGSRSGATAAVLETLLTALAAAGIVTDNTTS
jgi:hypothetical protein